MESAIALSDWFGGEAKRVYGLFVEDDGDRKQRELIEWIERKGGVVTPRDLQTSVRQYRASGTAEAALNSLAKANVGSWRTIATKRRPRREFALATLSTSTEMPESRGLLKTVDADSVDAARNGKPVGGIHAAPVGTSTNGQAEVHTEFEAERRRLEDSPDDIPF